MKQKPDGRYDNGIPYGLDCHWRIQEGVKMLKTYPGTIPDPFHQCIVFKSDLQSIYGPVLEKQDNDKSGNEQGI